MVRACTDGRSALVAGRAGGLVPGVHIRTDEAHPAQVLNTILHAVGVPDDLGEINGLRSL